MLASTQKAPASTITGSDYNSLRQDVKANHTHDGTDGVKVDHTDLTNIGSKTHAQIDADITSIYSSIAGGIPWTKIQIGYPLISQFTPVGSTYRHTFPTPFARVPVLICTLVFGPINDPARMSASVIAVNVSTTSFDLMITHPGVGGGDPFPYPFGSQFYPRTDQVSIHYVALEPPA